MSAAMPDDLRDACHLAADAAYNVAKAYKHGVDGLRFIRDEDCRDQLTDAIETQLAVWFAKHEA